MEIPGIINTNIKHALRKIFNLDAIKKILKQEDTQALLSTASQKEIHPLIT